jgi:hypothetical protein
VLIGNWSYLYFIEFILIENRCSYGVLYS